MAESLPPWLDVTPGSYTAAAEAGVSAGQRARSLDMEAQAHQQALQEAQAQKAQLQAEQALAIKDHAQQQATSRAAAAAQIQLQKQQIMQDMQKQNVAQAYKQMQFQQKQQEIDQKAQDAAAALDLRNRANQGLQDYRGDKNTLAEKALQIKQIAAQSGGKSDAQSQRLIADLVNEGAKEILKNNKSLPADQLAAKVGDWNKRVNDMMAAAKAATPAPTPAGAPMGQPSPVMTQPGNAPGISGPAIPVGTDVPGKGIWSGDGYLPGSASTNSPAAAFNAANPAPAAPAAAPKVFIPPAAIKRLQQDPSLADQFNEKYGVGAADQYLP